MVDDRLAVAVAVDIVAHRVLDHLVDADVVGDLWGDEYPEIGEHDWDRVCKRVRALIPSGPAAEEFAAAYEHLESRAEGE